MKTVLLVLTVLVSGCSTLAERVTEYEGTCSTVFGFEHGSEAMKTCVMEHELAYQVRANTVVHIPFAAPVHNPATGPRLQTHKTMMCDSNPFLC